MVSPAAAISRRRTSAPNEALRGVQLNPPDVEDAKKKRDSRNNNKKPTKQQNTNKKTCEKKKRRKKRPTIRGLVSLRSVSGITGSEALKLIHKVDT
jgi:hypothetical protein